jgi:hypothetical protein
VRPFYNRGASGPAGPPTLVTDNIINQSNPFRFGPMVVAAVVTIGAGDLIVVCVSQRNALAGPPTSVTVDGGGAPVTTLDVSSVGFPGSSVDTFVYHITGAAAGTRTVSVTAAGVSSVSIPTGMCIALIVLHGAAPLPFDKGATSFGNSAGPYAATTPALSQIDQYDIAVLGHGDDGSDDPRPWVAPFASLLVNQGLDPANDVSMYVASATSLTTAAVAASTSAVADVLDFALAVATFKGA